MNRTRLQCPTLLALALLGLAAALIPSTPAAAQYFGRNKVQYQTFDFHVLQTPHFDIYYYPEEAVATRDAARMAERWYARLSRLLDHDFDQRQPIILYGGTPAFQQTTTLQGSIGEGTGGVTEMLKQRVILPLTGSYQETDHVLGHELVHAFQYDISGLGRSAGALGAGARNFATAPLWFVEGMAEYFSKGPVDPLTTMWLRDAVLTGKLPNREQLENDPEFFPYRWGQALWAYVGGRWGDPVIGQILALVGQGVPYPDAFQRTLGISLDDLFEDWHVAIRHAYLPMLAERPEAREVAKPLITEAREGGQLNLGPAISPDGRLVAFISERQDLDIELWLADAQTGEVIRRLQKGTAFDPHFQSLRFINSAGSWSPDNVHFVFSAQREGHDELVFLDTRNGNITREVTIPDVIEIATPSWSSDGHTIVFAGISGGVSDLYTYDTKTGHSRRITNDLYAELHPSFSPDGKTVAYVTDQGPRTDLTSLRYGGYHIALLDLATGQTRLLPATLEGENINPEWKGDGSGLYFISNRTGIPNIYRLDLASGQLYRVTRLFGGVSGITDTSPAISVSRGTGRLLFTAYEKGGYNIYALSTQKELAGTLVADSGTVDVAVGGGDQPSTATPPLAAQLPPVPRPMQSPFNLVYTLIHDPETGLVSPSVAMQWPTHGYRPSLSLDYVGQPTVGVQVGTSNLYGTNGLYGAVSAVFSDILGYHTLFAAVQAQGQFDEIGFAVQYLNQKNRWNWGLAASRLPYIQPFLQRGFDQNGNLHDVIYRQRLFDNSLLGLVQYPFSEAQRVEFSAGLRRLSTDVQVFDINYTTGQVNRSKLPGFSHTWNLAQASAALVYDNALFNYTSPFAGQRYRFEITPTVGSSSFTQALADFRHYFWFRPFTLAVQGLHFGRYGANTGDYFSEDQATRQGQLFYPIFLGDPSLVRGYYNVYSDYYNGRLPADTAEANRETRVVNYLFGNRILVGKAEVRFPLVRALVIGPIAFPPIEGFAFFDGGVAWNRGQKLDFSRGVIVDQSGDVVANKRAFLTSTGVGGRVNILGYVVLEVDYVKPLELHNGWHWEFALQPGF
ncbi:MAG TPA: hypothetical protein VFL93_13735 [Longimicrobiaceae bacterium]|nr:hypothetical protein [Longimicrobiaceae bacterium]